MRKTCVIVFALLLLLLSSCAVSEFPVYKLSESTRRDEISIDFLDVGKADCILIKTKNSAFLIDAAMDDNADDILAFLKQRGVDRLDGMMITHFDKDHVGGADVILGLVPVDAVYIPSYHSNASEYHAFTDSLEKSDATKKTLFENTSFELDGLEFYVDVANKRSYGANEENDYSLITSMKYGNVSFLFAADAENKRLLELLEEKVGAHTVLKVNHHGRYHDASEEFIDAVSPSYAVIMTDDKQKEDERVLTKLDDVGATVYVTRNGTVTCKTDGIDIELIQ